MGRGSFLVQGNIREQWFINAALGQYLYQFVIHFATLKTISEYAEKSASLL